MGIGIDGVADQAIGAGAGAGVFSKEQCAELAKALDGLPPREPMWTALDVFERWSHLDIVLETAMGENTELAKGDPMFAALGTIDLGEVDWDEVLRRFNEIDDAYVAAMKVEGRAASLAACRDVERKIGKRSGGKDADLTKDSGETRAEYTQRVMRWMENSVLASFWAANDRWHVGGMVDEMARAVVGAAAYKAEKGEWPGKLEELVPGYLKEVPVDLYLSGETEGVKYVRGSGGVRVYSVGRNGVDDGGVERDGGDDVVVGWREGAK